MLLWAISGRKVDPPKESMRKAIFILLLVTMITAVNSFASDWYVRKAATGSNNGTSWTNAWQDFNNISFSSVACGDTIWVAGGTYTGSMTINKTCSAGNVLTIKRVLSSDSVPASAAGWDSSFDSQVVNQNGGVTMQGSYWTIDGRVGDAAKGVAYGMQWIWPTKTGTAFSNSSGTQSHITLTHLEIYGPVCVSNNGNGSFGSGTCSGNTWGINLNQGSGNSNFLLDHIWVHRWAEVIRPYQTTNLTIQYSYIGDSAYTPADHNDCMYASDPFSGLTFRYNRVYSCSNQGLWFDNNGVVNAVIYDNIFYHSSGAIIGFPRCGSQSTCGPIYLFNNIFEDDGDWGEGNTSTLQTEAQPLNSNSAIQNNIFYTVTSSMTTSLFSNDASTTGNSISKCTNCFNYTAGSPQDAFNGWMDMCGTSCTGPEAVINADFHLTAAGQTLFQGKGINLTSTACANIDPGICTDMDGNPRPSSGSWTLGPYESGSSSSNQPPAAPTQLSAVVQ